MKTIPKGLTFQNKGDGQLDIYIYDYIGPEWAGMVGAKTVANELKQHDGITSISLHINSAGGSVTEALGIYNQLVNHNAEVVVDIDGLAASSAGWVAMAGDEIRIAENAQFMVHDPYMYAGGNAAEMRKQADVLDKMKASIVMTFANRTGLESDEISQMMTDETWLSGEEAVEKGFADKLNGCKAVECSADLSAYNNVPDAAKALVNREPKPEQNDDVRETLNEIKTSLDDMKSSQQNTTKPEPMATGPSDDELIDQVNSALV